MNTPPKAPLRELELPLVDGENNAVDMDVAYAVGGDQFLPTINSIEEKHGNDFCVLPLSGKSGGGGIFQSPKPEDATVVGLQLSATPQPRVTNTEKEIDLAALGLDEIVIDKSNRHIYAGASITLEQLNRALEEQLGQQYKVLGADLTSYTYAQVGATFMTGGMGPQRRYFSDSVCAIALYDGAGIRTIAGSELTTLAGTYGWSGIVTAVCCNFHELPKNEIAFAIPVQNSPARLAQLLQHFSPNAYLDTDAGIARTSSGGDDLILGLEHVTVGAMQPFLESGDNALTRRAKQLAENCNAAGADGLIFVSGFSNQVADDFLLSLLDDSESDPTTIAATMAGIDLAHTEIFNDPEQMRAVREGVPFAARTQSPKGRYIYKGHTDANIHLHPDYVETAMNALWQANEKYINEVETYYANNPSIRGEVLVYGHLNPVGVDPHNRITFACDNKQDFDAAKVALHRARDEFYRTLKTICEATQSSFVGGEKASASELEIVSAFGELNAPPANVADTLIRRSKAIESANRRFSWRSKL